MQIWTKIEVEFDEDLEVIESFKRLMGLTWKDILVAGVLYWMDELGGEEGIKKRLQIQIKKEGGHDN